MDIKVLLDKIVEYLEDKKAKDIDVIHIGGKSLIADYFIICSGTSTTHIKALSDELGEKLYTDGLDSPHIEGYDTARWILMDYGDVIVHLFHEEDRKFYNLERLWNDTVKKIQ